METKNKTLYMLSCTRGKYVEMVWFYAVGEEDAWSQANEWANEKEIVLPKDAQLLHFPRGFQLNTRTLPGEIQEP